MSEDDQRNTMIVEMGIQTRMGSVLQDLSSLELVLLGLGKTGPGGQPTDIGRGSYIRGVMSDDDQRNTMIAEMGVQTGLDAQLQGLINLDLVRMAFGLLP